MTLSTSRFIPGHAVAAGAVAVAKTSRLFTLAVFFATLLIPGQEIQASQTHESAVFSSVGNPYPSIDQPGIDLDKEIVYLMELDTMATWRFAYLFKNQNATPQEVEMCTPVVVYFDDFRPETRSPIIDNLAELYPDLFAVADAQKDINGDLRAKFGGRLFVKRFVNQMDLARAGIAYSLQVDGENRAVTKIGLEFRWDSKPGTVPSLQMKVNFYHQLKLSGGGQTELIARLKIPSAIRTENPERYISLEMGGPHKWNGTISSLYLVNKLDGTRPLLSKGLQQEQKLVGSDGLATVLRNVNTVGLRIGFYLNKPSEGTYYLPSGITEISASSSETISVNKAANPRLEGLSVTERIFDLELRRGLSNVAPSWSSRTLEGFNLPESIQTKAADRMAEAAFDRSPGSDRGYLNTSWCEQVDGGGKGQRLTFTLVQPARGMYLENGDQSSKENYTRNGRLRSARLKSTSGNLNELLAVNDIRVLNGYELDLPMGTYSLEINSVFPGKSGKTCLGALYFDFLLGEEWFDQKFPAL